MVTDRSEHSLSPNFSPTPIALYTRSTELCETANTLPNYSTYVGFSQRAGGDRDGLLSSYRGSPYHQMDGTNTSLIRRNSDPNSQQSTQSSSDSLEDEDKPLDMSNKKYRNSNCSESQMDFESKSDSLTLLSKSPPNSSTFTKLFGQQMMRPSVITCGSSLMKAQQTAQPSQPSATVQSLSPTSNCQNCGTKNGDNSNDDTNDGEYIACKRHRERQIVITEEVSDPVIEEHFRRSLGKDYSEIFSNSPNNNSITYSGKYSIYIKIG